MSKFFAGVCVGIIIGALSLVCGVMVANAQTAQTTVTVVIVDEVSSANVTATVPCNEVNCPEVEVEQVSWWGGIINWFKSIF